MQTSSTIKSLLFVCFISMSISFSYAQLSTKHYIPPLTSGPSNANPQDQWIYISTPSTGLVPYTITEVGGANTTGTVSNTTPQVIAIGNGFNTQLFQNYDQSSTVTTNKGYIIEADAPVYVSVRMNAGGAQAGALVSKGESALDTTFRIGTYTNDVPTNTNSFNNYLSFVSVMATEDGTTVNFDDLPPGLNIANYTGTLPFSINLNESETYVIALKSDQNSPNLMDGLIGCLVTSNNPIVVNCGSANGSFHNGGGRDYGIDQIAGLSKIGDEYILVKGGGSNDWENVLVVAHEDNTTISLNGNATPVATLNAGEYHLIEGNNFINDNMYVSTSESVFVYQGVGAPSSGEANQAMFFVPPLDCKTRGNVNNIANIERIGNTIYDGGITIVTKNTATVTVTSSISGNINLGTPTAVTGKNDYITYRISPIIGDITVEGNDELYVAYFNQNGAATSGSFYSGFQTKPEFNFDVQFATLGNCIGNNLTLSIANAQNFESFQWWYDDGTGYITLSETSASLTPTVPGKYKVIGQLPCNGGPLESAEVPISICPDDIDNDGIIDNIDIDNDNDGIDNCTESRGNVTLNIANTNTPILVFQDATINNAIVSSSYTETSLNGSTNGITGDASGNFTSVLGNDPSAESTYSLDFNAPVNVKLEETNILNISTLGEFYVVSITPSNKNITLIDPDDRLLIDTNFDGFVESGVTQISGSEIHFQINPTPNGNTPFQFFANSVNGFSFTHKLQNLTDPSTFTANLSLTCFKNDNDNDGIKDELDLDSDNDGIPDIIERSGTIVTLTGNDSNNDGLDDVFTGFVPPIDTDGDGVVDFYDLDSDNDGIYDLIETGQLGTLSDTNLDGIEDGPTYGTNGWADAAETTPDSNVMGYTLDDFDTDTVFSYIDHDSDGDTCSDVIEAGFSDGDNDDYLGDVPVTVDSNGLVTNAPNGYTLPDANYLDFAPITIDSQLSTAIICENSNFTIPLVSPDAQTIQWEISMDSGTTWASMTDDATFSGTNTFNLNISNAPLTINNYVFRAFLNRTGNTCGFYSEEVNITVDALPIANTASNMLLCDDDNNGTMPFDLTLQNNSITTNSGMTITYHETQADADNNTNSITSPFESGNTTIYARVENNANTTCYDTSSFNLVVFESPFPLLNVTPLQECDDTSVGTDSDGLKTFDLTQKETEILNGQSSTDFTLTYFSDASYTTQIVTPTAFNNTIPNSQTVYVRVTSNAYNTCIADTSFEVEVFSLPIVNIPNEYAQCDDASNDGLAFFNLTLDQIKEEINPNHVADGLIFTYHETSIEANNAGIEISTPNAYQNTTLGFLPQTVYIRVENPNTCFRVVPLTIRVNPYSGALDTYTPTPLYQCDNGTDLRDGVSSFNMTSIRDHISNIIFSGFNVTVHFFESQMNAELETNEILDIANHQNTNSPNTQSIWVRVKSDLGNDCLGLHEFSNLLNVEALPVANNVIFNRECDHDTNDTLINYPFDTLNLEANILDGQNPANVTISYYDDLGNPLFYADGITPVTSPIQATFLTETQTITVRVTNNTTLAPNGPCYDETTINFVVDEQPFIANNVPDQIFCDGSATDIDDDGIFSFDTSNFTSTILGTQSSMDIFYFYRDENGNPALSIGNLPNPLSSSSQTIFVEVENPINPSCIASTTINLVVNPLPEFTVNSPLIVCTSDPTFSVELDPIESNPSEIFDYEWRWTSTDGTVTNQLLPQTTSTIDVSTPGTYHVTLIKTDGTGCSRTRDIFVNASEQATITNEDVTIVDFTENSNSVLIDTTNLGQGDYEFALKKDDEPFILYQDSPQFDDVKPGFYTIYVNDKKGCGVSTLDISVLGYMKFFTPNNDSYNDEWKIIGVSANFQPNSRILIFNRYGKLLKQLSTLQDGWDGRSRGTMMPTDDYWFKVFLEDGRVFSGHFTLKR